MYVGVYECLCRLLHVFMLIFYCQNVYNSAGKRFISHDKETFSFCGMITGSHRKESLFADTKKK